MLNSQLIGAQKIRPTRVMYMNRTIALHLQTEEER
jgi:hypothetical protein